MEASITLFLASVKTICPGVTDEELSFFASRLNVVELQKKELFVQSGKIQKAIGFIAKGLVRSYIIDRDGVERTVGFYPEGEYATHYPAFIAQKPSLYTIQCLEPTELVCLSFADIQSIYKTYPVFEQYGRLIAEEVLKQQQARIESFVFQNAEERYLDFMQQRPSLFNRVSLSQLCSYLGIERQTLTRIRHRIAHS
ncbi:MAG: Crp/Fnr family transcriptional regulator [Citrobacter freundii]|nr:MAG: Crp/Fnr family transcriptional regulator [Citrobacter freundii]